MCRTGDGLISPGWTYSDLSQISWRAQDRPGPLHGICDLAPNAGRTQPLSFPIH